MGGVGAYTNKLIGGFVTLLIGLAIIPLINTEITTSTASGGALYGVDGAGLLAIIPLIAIVALVMVIIPKKG